LYKAEKSVGTNSAGGRSLRTSAREALGPCCVIDTGGCLQSAYLMVMKWKGKEIKKLSSASWNAIRDSEGILIPGNRVPFTVNISRGKKNQEEKRRHR